MFGNGFEHPAHETGGSPVDHDDAPAGAADAHQLGCHTFGARRKHGAHQAEHNIKRSILIRQLFRIPLISNEKQELEWTDAQEDNRSASERLNELGEDGWELINVAQHAGDRIRTVYWLKRPKN